MELLECDKINFLSYGKIHPLKTWANSNGDVGKQSQENWRAKKKDKSSWKVRQKSRKRSDANSQKAHDR